MIHLPYQDWLFDEEQELTATQAAELQQHLGSCGECRSLAGALNQMERSLKQMVMAAPEEGFTMRWQARLEEGRRRAHRRQTALTMIFTLSSAVTLLSMLTIFLWPWLAEYKMAFWAAIYQLYSVYLLLAGVGEFLTQLLRAMAEVIPLAGWVLAIGMVFELGVLWVVSYRLLTNPRRLDLQ